MITGLTAPSSGKIAICGMDISEKLGECQDRIGYCPQSNALFGLLTVNEHLEFFANLKGVDEEEWRGKREELIRRLGLEHVRGSVSSDLFHYYS